MTVLEIAMLGGIVAVIAIESKRAWQTPRSFLAALQEATESNKLFAIGTILIFIASIIGIIVSPDKRAALGVARAFFWEPMLLSWLIITAKPDAEVSRKAFLAGLAVSAGIAIVWGFIQYLHPAFIPEPWPAERRITGIFPFPNALALYLAPLVSLFMSSPWGLVISIPALGAIVLAKSAGGLGAVFASLLFLGAAFKKTRWPALSAAFIILLAVAFLPQAGNLRDQIMLKDWSGRVHQIGWNESLAMLRDHPLWGAGLSGFPATVVPYHKAQGVEIFQYPHNIVLAVWSELGLLGLLGFLLVLAWFFKKALRRNGRWAMDNGRFLVAAMVAIICHGLVDVPYFKNDLATIFWLLAAIVAL